MPSLMPHGKQSYHDNNGNPLSGGRVYTYESGTSTPLATYADAAGTAMNTNPVLLNARGEANIFWGPAPYKVVVKDASDVEIYTQDNLQAPVGRKELASVTAGEGASLVGIEDVAGHYAGTTVEAALAEAQSFTHSATGAVARSLRSRLSERVSVKDFGAVGDGVADDTEAFQAAIAALPGGGEIFVPSGWYRITETLILHSGLTFAGATQVNLTFGTPTNAERPSHIFIDGLTALFSNVQDVQLESVTFRDLSLASKLFPSTTTTASTTGVQLVGSNPVDAKRIVFERVTFSCFGVAINVNDPAAGTTDWNCAPVTLNDCTFYYNDIGVRLNADNADMWVFQNCSWFQNTGDIGVYALRSGTMTFISCHGGGGIWVYFNGDSRDATKFIACQYESATAMLVVEDTMTAQQTFRPITFDGCIVEADVSLASSCHFISIGCRYVNTVTVTGGDVVIDSLFDRFIGGGPAAFNITGTNSEIRNFIASEPTASGVRGPIFNGQMQMRATAAPASGGPFNVGDVAWNSGVDTGEHAGWICIAAGSPGTWVPFGRIGYRSQAGSPLGSVTPLYVGEEFFDTATSKWHKSWGMTSANWALLT